MLTLKQNNTLGTEDFDSTPVWRAEQRPLLRIPRQLLPALLYLPHPCGRAPAAFVLPAHHKPMAERPKGRARVKRIETMVQWTIAPLNGLATDGEPWAFERSGIA